MKKTAFLYGNSLSSKEIPSGAVNRKRDVNIFLTEAGFDVIEINSLPKSEFDASSILVLVSFSSAKLIRKSRKRFNFIWLDATDSWKLTRRQLFRLNLIAEPIKYLRDLYHSLQYQKVDLITYCSKRDLIYDDLKTDNALVLNHRFCISSPSLSDVRRFVFVGHGSYPPNEEAVKFLLLYFKNNITRVKLHIFGAGYEKYSSTLNVTFEGLRCDSEIYKSSDVHLVPIWHGAGVKYKTLNALAHGLRVISSVEGANGFIENESLLVAHNHSEFIDLIRLVSEDERRDVADRPNIESPILEDDDCQQIVNILERRN